MLLRKLSFHKYKIWLRITLREKSAQLLSVTMLILLVMEQLKKIQWSVVNAVIISSCLKIPLQVLPICSLSQSAKLMRASSLRFKRCILLVAQTFHQVLLVQLVQQVWELLAPKSLFVLMANQMVSLTLNNTTSKLVNMPKKRELPSILLHSLVLNAKLIR